MVGPHGDALRIRLAAPPVDGAANEALVAFLARRLDVAAAAITLRHGASGRRKVVDIAGLDPADVQRVLLG